MKNKIILLMISGVLISFSALSQTTEKSSHPKLDSFYKLKQNSRAAIVSDTAKSNSTITSTNPTPSSTPTQSLKTSAAPSQSTSTVSENNTKPTANVTPESKPQQPVQTAPVKKPIYSETRLGSSSKQYDTYEKNNNGAGAVTTSPK